jgi:hypothetical protein
MVGLWFLVPAIGVRVPDRQLVRKAPVRVFFCTRAVDQVTVWETVT